MAGQGPEQQNIAFNFQRGQDFSKTLSVVKKFSTQADSPEFKKNMKNAVKNNPKTKKVEEMATGPLSIQMYKTRIEEIDKKLEEIREAGIMLANPQRLREMQEEKSNLEIIVKNSEIFNSIPKRQSFDKIVKKYEKEEQSVSNANLEDIQQQKKRYQQSMLKKFWSSQDKYNNHYETQRLSQAESFSRIQNIISSLPSGMTLPTIVYKVWAVNTYSDLTKAEIIKFQNEIGLFFHNADGLFGKTTYNMAVAYFDKKLSAYKNTKNKKSEEQKKAKLKAQKEKDEAKSRDKGKNLDWKDPLIAEQERKDNNEGNLQVKKTEKAIQEDRWDVVEENKPTKENAKKIKEETSKKYNLKQQTKEQISFAKGLSGEAKEVKDLETSLKDIIFEKKSLKGDIVKLEEKKSELEESKNDSKKNPDEIAEIDNMITKLAFQIKWKKELLNELEHKSIEKSSVFKIKQLSYLKKIQSEIQVVKWEIAKINSSSRLDGKLQEKLSFLTAIEWSQRMLSWVDNIPNRYGFYMTEEGVLLRRNKIDESNGNIDPEQDFAEWFYDTDEFWRLIYFDKTTERVEPKAFFWFNNWYKPQNIGNLNTEKIITENKKEILWVYDRKSEHWDSPTVTWHNDHQENKKDEAQDNTQWK